jgi:DUF4097 and DUF4098 domain-containing protein YvlB
MRIAMAAGLVAGSIVMVASAIGAETIKEVREMKVATAPGAALSVQTANGGIEIVPTDSSEMRIKATISAKSKARLDAVHIAASNDAAKGNDVRVDFPPPAKGEEEGCSLIIEVPRATNVKLVATNGGLSMSGTAGSASLDSSNGSVTIKGHDGPATVHTSNGSITASAISGSAALKTSNGPVTLHGAAQPFQIETSNGPVQVTLAPEFAGIIAMATSNGKVAFPKDAKVESQSGNKGYGNAEAKISIGSGAESSSIQTSNGPVEVKSAR